MAEPLHVSRSLAHDLALVIHELAINAWKHGYDGMSGGELAIHCGRTADGHLDLLVMDRGKGFGESTTTAAGHGLGMEIIRSTVQRLRGEFLIENNQGAHAQLRVPLGEEGIRLPPSNREYSA